MLIQKTYKKKLAVAINIMSVLCVILIISGCTPKTTQDDSANESKQTYENTVEITFDCPGWTSNNVNLGLFIDGIVSNGKEFNEQLMFENGETQTMKMTHGSYEFIPQFPMVMLMDGTVMAVDNVPVIAFDSDAGGHEKLTFTYTEIDASTISDEEIENLTYSTILNDEDIAAAKEAFYAKRNG